MVAHSTADMTVRERYRSKRKTRIDALAHKVAKRIFITTTLIAIVLLLIVFLRPETFEVDDGPHRFGEVEKVVPRSADTRQ
jgi:predicted secreted protein